MKIVRHIGLSLREKIVAKSKVDPHTGCWVWQFGLSPEGYAYVKDDGARYSVRAARVAYELWREPIPESLTLDHLCRNRACVNPWHLEAVPNRTNVLRGVGLSAQNARKTRCPRGHEYDAENTQVHNGKRYCRACRRDRQRERRGAVA